MYVDSPIAMAAAVDEAAQYDFTPEQDWFSHNIPSWTALLPHVSSSGRERYERIHHNLRLAGGKFRVLDMFSFPALMTLLTEATTETDAGFDWVYVDGSHEADDTREHYLVV
jgi:hypothetical protein